jgi:hypothetical protein
MVDGVLVVAFVVAQHHCWSSGSLGLESEAHWRQNCQNLAVMYLEVAAQHYFVVAC